MQRQPPGILWISIIGLIATAVLQVAAAHRSGVPVICIGVVINLLVAAGLYRANKLAYVTLLVLAIAGVLVAVMRHPVFGLGVLVLNGIIVAPVLLSHDYFWNPAARRTAAARSRYCHRCGNSLASATGGVCPRCGEPIRRAAPAPPAK